MIPEPDLLDAAAAIAADARITNADALPGGSSATVVRLSLTTPGGSGRDVVVRQHSDRVGKGHAVAVAAKEFELLRHLVGNDLEVPAPLALHGDTTAGGPWLATEFVDGSAPVGRSDPEAVLDAMAAFLVRLHSLDPSSLSVPGLARIEDPAEALPGHLPSDPVARELAGALRDGIDRSPNDDALLHGDFWPGNVLMSDQRLVAVVDWEDAAVGDPLVDLACARVEITCADGREWADHFTGAYLDASGPLDRTDLPLWEAYVAATALSSMHLWGLDADDEAERRATTRACFDRAAAAVLTR